MGGRYGASDDGSSDYQDRRPDDDDRRDEQQTIAEAVQAVADQQHADENKNAGKRTENDASSGERSGQHPFTAIRHRGTSRSRGTTLQEVDQKIAEYVADQLTGTVEQAVEEADPEDDP